MISRAAHAVKAPCPIPSSKLGYIWRFPKIRGTLFGGPHSKDYNILGSILESPYLGNLPFRS